MREKIVLAGPLALCVLLLSLLTGCGTQSLSGSRALDPTRLRIAIELDDVGYVRDAVSSGAAHVNQHIPASAYMEGTPLMTVAARAGSLKVMSYLISAGADVNGRTPAGETPLMLAAYFREAGGIDRHEAAVKLLINAGADLENEPYSYTPLAYASYKGHEHIVRFLLERGASVNADARDGTTYINTPLMMASIMGHFDTAMLLLRAGADPRIRVMGGHTAREFALKYNHASLARTLACAESFGPGEALAGKCR